MNTILHSDFTIGYQGGPGSYHETAAIELGLDETRLIGYDTFAEVFDAVRNGHLGGALVAIANNAVGIIPQPFRELTSRDGLWVCGETYVRIQHQLLGHAGAEIEDIREVRSQAPALGQCEANLDRYLPGVRRVEVYDTAASAREVAETGDKSIAAIASARAGELHGLSTIRSDFQDDIDNITRFLVVRSRSHAYTADDANRTTMMLETPQVPGSLARVLSWFAETDINLANLQSTFIPNSAFDMRFFVEFDAGLKDERAITVMSELAQNGFKVDILGSYVSASIPMKNS